jgi:hypothetical protein
MDILIAVLSIVLPIIIGMVTYFVRGIMSRIEKLETAVDSAMTEHQMRQILSDKIDPVKEDVTDIKNSVQKLFDLYFKKRGR